MSGLRGITEDLVRARLFLVSYVPLWLVLAFRAAPSGRWHWDGRTAIVIVFGVTAVWGIIDAVRLIRGSGKTSPRRLFFGEINDQGGNAAGYLATYLLPFIGLVPEDWGDWAAYALYFVVALIVFIRTDLTFVNPTLYILNHRVVSASAYLPEDRSLVPGSPFVTSIGGGFVTKDEPKVSRGRGQRREMLSRSREDLGATGHEGRVEGD